MMLVAALDQVADWSQIQVAGDFCASPGGKTTHLLSRMPPGSALLANEPHPLRYQILRENLQRWGHPQAISARADARQYQALGPVFDLLLVDAPCSGEGMIRKDIQAAEHWSEANIRQCTIRQKAILESILPTLRQDGILAYSTCTFNSRENEEIGDWLIETAGLEPVKVDLPDWGQVRRRGKHSEVTVCYPHKVAGEGFAFQLFRKKTGERQPPGKTPAGKNWRRSKPADTPHPFLLTAMTDREHWQHENGAIYQLSPIQAELVARLEAIRVQAWPLAEAGLFKGRDFVPAHDLALNSLIPADWPGIDLDLPAALDYLKGNAPQSDVSPVAGWHLARYKGHGLGWLKGVSGRTNNYLPKQLRIRMETGRAGDLPTPLF